MDFDIFLLEMAYPCQDRPRKDGGRTTRSTLLDQQDDSRGELEEIIHSLFIDLIDHSLSRLAERKPVT